MRMRYADSATDVPWLYARFVRLNPFQSCAKIPRNQLPPQRVGSWRRGDRLINQVA